MMECILVVTISGLVEVIHVQLSNKGSKIIVLEISRDDFVDKLSEIFNYKGLSIVCPTNYVVVFSVLIYKKDFTSRI